MQALTLILLFIFCAYLLRMSLYRHDWKRYPAAEPEGPGGSTAFSIVVPFRDESENLPGLVGSLLNQDYPAALREIILVDDHSTDGSARLAREYAEKWPGVRYLRIDGDEVGKKAALSKGVHEAANGYVVTTDADCTAGSQWLSALDGIIRTRKPDMVIGLVDMQEGKGFTGIFQHMEFLGLVAAGAAAAAGGRPVYCNGANLAYRKELMDSLPDPMHRETASGDDTLFMHRVKQSGSQGIVLLKSRAGTVTTRGCTSLSGYFAQRIRWASRRKQYADADTLLLALLVLMVSVATVLSLVMLLTGRNIWLYPAALILKAVADYRLTAGFTGFLTRKVPVFPFLVCEVIHPFLVVISAAGAIVNRYAWKGRVYPGKG